MATLKYSKQREAIKTYLESTKSHPSADMVFLHVKEQFPNISLGTIYRNLNLLSDLGEIIKITTPDGADRFDAEVKPHYHFCCKQCGDVLDLDIPNLCELNEYAEKNFNGIIEGHSLLFHGICDHCKNQK